MLAASLALTCAIGTPVLPALAGEIGLQQRPSTDGTDVIATRQLSDAARWSVLAVEVANDTGVPWQVLRAVINIESRGNSGAYDPDTGRMGLMMVGPDVKQQSSLGEQADLWDPETNIRVGAEFLAAAHARWGSWELAVAAYASGNQDITAAPFPHDYVERFRGALARLGYQQAEPPQTAFIQATRALGVPYVWGGQSPETGFDCSGLVWWVYQQLGIDIPRDGTAQQAATTPIDAGQLRPGDLVFFSYDGPGGWVYHVGIYAGNGLMLHAPREGGVVEYTSLSNPWWAGTISGYGRVE
jgi:cell wall-associated NlpC family hydrolase